MPEVQVLCFFAQQPLHSAPKRQLLHTWQYFIATFLLSVVAGATTQFIAKGGKTKELKRHLIIARKPNRLLYVTCWSLKISEIYQKVEIGPKSSEILDKPSHQIRNIQNQQWHCLSTSLLASGPSSWYTFDSFCQATGAAGLFTSPVLFQPNSASVTRTSLVTLTLSNTVQNEGVILNDGHTGISQYYQLIMYYNIIVIVGNIFHSDTLFSSKTAAVYYHCYVLSYQITWGTSYDLRCHIF